jgi:soluble P-type ATPase
VITIEIPGKDSITIEHVVFDYNGTIAVDGILETEVIPRLQELKKFATVRILTADTYGTVRKQCEPFGIEVETFKGANVAQCKEEIVKKLNGNVCCIGNGFNDRKMFEVADLRIAVMGKEGMYPGLLEVCDILVGSPVEAVELLLRTDRVKATLRT